MAEASKAHLEEGREAHSREKKKKTTSPCLLLTAVFVYLINWQPEEQAHLACGHVNKIIN